MNRTATSFLLLALLTGLLVALSFALQIKGYGFGELGISRLDDLAGATIFLPLAAIYSLAGLLIMILPLRAAGFVHANSAIPIYSASLVLLATLVGVQVTRFAFGNDNAIWALGDWRYLFAAAIIGAHLALDMLRRNMLLRTLSFIGFVLATLACLYWTFE